MDIIFVKDLKLPTLIGAFAWEHEFKQPLLLDFELQTDAKKAAAHDDLTDTYNYLAISEAILTKFSDHKCELMETLAERIAAMIMQDFGVNWIRLNLRKPAIIAAAKEVGIMIERGEKIK